MKQQKSFACIELTIQCHHSDHDYLLFDSTSDPGTPFPLLSTLDHSLKLFPGVHSLHLSHSRAPLPIPSFRSFSTFFPRFFLSLPSTAGPPNLPRRFSRRPLLHRRPFLPLSLRLRRGFSFSLDSPQRLFSLRYVALHRFALGEDLAAKLAATPETDLAANLAAEQWIQREMEALIECFELCSRGSDQFPAGSVMSGLFRGEIALQACQATFFLFVSPNELNEFEESNLENSVPETENIISEPETPPKERVSQSSETPSDIPAEVEPSGKWIESEMSRKVLE